MVRTKWSAGWFAAAFALCLVGCKGDSPGVDPEYMKTAESIGKARREIFVRSQGEYDRMSPEDRKAYLEGFKNDEGQARKFWDAMKNPPIPGPRIPKPGGN